MRDGSQVNISRDQESLHACVDTAHVRGGTGSARRSSSWPPPITQDPFHCLYFIFDSVKVLIWKVVIVIPRAFREGGQNYGVLVFQKATLIPTAQVKDGGSGTAWRS